MRPAELARAVAVRSERLDELAVLVELRDAADAVGRILIEELRVVRFGDEDAAVGSDQHVIRLGELRRRIAGFAGRAERHQQLALRAELQHRVALALRIGKLRELLPALPSAHRRPRCCPGDRHPCRAATGSVPRRSSATTLPLGSSLTIGSTFEPAHTLAPQRSPAQMCLPSMSTCTALTDPHRRPSGSVPQLRTVSYGFGRLLIGVTLACSGGPDAPRGGAAGVCAGSTGATSYGDRDSSHHGPHVSPRHDPP